MRIAVEDQGVEVNDLNERVGDYDLQGHSIVQRLAQVSARLATLSDDERASL